MFFMSLDVSPEFEPDVHTVVQFTSCHDVPWQVLVQHTVPMREGVQPEYRVLDEVNDDYSWDTSKWQHPVCASRPILDSSNVPFHLRDVLIGGTAVDLWEPWSEAFKFVVCHYARHCEATMTIQPAHCLQFISHGVNLPIWHSYARLLYLDA